MWAYEEALGVYPVPWDGQADRRARVGTQYGGPAVRWQFQGNKVFL
jgi:hypothetical protein